MREGKPLDLLGVDCQLVKHVQGHHKQLVVGAEVHLILQVRVDLVLIHTLQLIRL